MNYLHKDEAMYFLSRTSSLQASRLLSDCLLSDCLFSAPHLLSERLLSVCLFYRTNGSATENQSWFRSGRWSARTVLRYVLCTRQA